MPQPKRNEPCPCGSGKKFKRCHGKVQKQPPVPQAISEAVRFVCFETGLVDFRLATNGGTAFVVTFRGKAYCITCKHVVQGFEIGNLVITDARMGKRVAAVKGMYIPDNLRLEAEGTDISDLCVIDFETEKSDFFDGAYDLDRIPIARGEPANRLIATGFLKEKSFIQPPNIFVSLCFLQLTDAGAAPFDHSLRRGIATYAGHGFDSVAGMSGAPVFNLNANALCGMIARGGLFADGTCTMYFIDIFDIIQFIGAIHSGLPEVRYSKDRFIL